MLRFVLIEGNEGADLECGPGGGGNSQSSLQPSYLLAFGNSSDLTMKMHFALCPTTVKLHLVALAREGDSTTLGSTS